MKLLSIHRHRPIPPKIAKENSRIIKHLRGMLGLKQNVQWQDVYSYLGLDRIHPVLCHTELVEVVKAHYRKLVSEQSPVESCPGHRLKLSSERISPLPARPE